ncbi:hypothetical protein AWB78_08394 [Caballeronia calidae]|uniref:Uncharacterized protein n=1 Tax=Caballeronia calidae TaxID=1777139 RepID=A0A158EJL9_9BURK|nr:hypothetical protein [Caballeronia calidae]SAL07058.1 hypothetical protein AWB78_08394 [Caballeronia calidae]
MGKPLESLDACNYTSLVTLHDKLGFSHGGQQFERQISSMTVPRQILNNPLLMLYSELRLLKVLLSQQ